MPTKATPKVFRTDALKSDVRAALFDHIRHMDMTFSMMTETQQTSLAHDIEQIVDFVIKGAVDVVAAQDLPTLKATCGEVHHKKNGQIEAKIGINGKDERRLSLYDAVGMPLVVVVANPDQFDDGSGGYIIDKDQPDLLD